MNVMGRLPGELVWWWLLVSIFKGSCTCFYMALLYDGIQ